MALAVITEGKALKCGLLFCAVAAVALKDETSIAVLRDYGPFPSKSEGETLKCGLLYRAVAVLQDYGPFPSKSEDETLKCGLLYCAVVLPVLPRCGAEGLWSFPIQVRRKDS